MNLPASIADLIRRLRSRWAIQRLLARGPCALAAGSAVFLAGTIILDVLAAGPPAGAALFGTACGVILVVALSALVRRPNALALARVADIRLGLKDALSSAVAFSRSAPTPFASLAVREAARMAATADPRRVVRYRTRTPVLGLALVLAGAAAAWSAVAPLDHRRSGSDAAPAIAAGPLDRVEDAVNRVVAGAGDETAVQDAARRARKVIDDLRRHELDADEALARLAEIDGALEGTDDAAWPERLAEALRGAGRDLRGNALTDDTGRRLEHGETPAAQKSLRRAADAVAANTAPTDADRRAFREAARKLQRAADTLKPAAPDLANRLDRAAADLDAQQLADAAARLRDSADALGDLDRQKDRLRKLKAMQGQIARLKNLVRDGRKPDKDDRMALLMDEVPDDLRRMVLPSTAARGSGRGPTGVGTADTGSGAGGKRTQLAGRRTPEHVSGRPGADGPTVRRVVRSAATGGASTVKYSEVYAQYEAQAEAAMEADEIPVGYRFCIRRYFEGIRPE